MKKVLLSIAALFTVATYASAQETGFGFGPKVGINLSNQTLLDGDYKTGNMLRGLPAHPRGAAMPTVSRRTPDS